MKLYDFNLAPGPRRVRIFLKEKNIELPLVEVNTREKGQFTESFRQKNPGFTIPVLELDDGTCISETVAICRYFEETHPEPCLFGHDTVSRAVTEMWNRRVELQGYQSIGDIVRNTAPMFADRGLAGVEGGVPQIAALAERGRGAIARFSTFIDKQLSDNQYVAGANYSIADITLYVTYEFAKRGEVEIPHDCSNLRRWWDEVSQRPSMDA